MELHSEGQHDQMVGLDLRAELIELFVDRDTQRLEDASRRMAPPARRRNANLHQRISGDGYGPVVAAESGLLDQLAEAVAASLPARG